MINGFKIKITRVDGKDAKSVLVEDGNPDLNALELIEMFIDAATGIGYSRDGIEDYLKN